METKSNKHRDNTRTRFWTKRRIALNLLIAGVLTTTWCIDPSRSARTQRRKVQESLAAVGIKTRDVRYRVVAVAPPVRSGSERDGDENSTADAVSESGVVVGGVSTREGYRGYRWEKGQLTLLPTLPGSPDSRATAISSSGIIVGTADSMTPPASEFVNPHAIPLVWRGSGAKPERLPKHDAKWAYEPTGVSDNGIVAGMASFQSPYVEGYTMTYRRFIVRKGKSGRYSLRTPLAGEPGIAVTKSGVLFYSKYIDVNDYLVREDTRTGKVEPIGFIPAGARQLWQLASNEAGDTLALTFDVSSAQSEPLYSNYVWKIGTVKGKPKMVRQEELSPLASVKGKSELSCHACAVSRSGEIVGSQEDYAPTGNHAVLWDREEKALDLNDYIPPFSGWVLREAKGINGRGWIVGNGTIHGRQQGFLLIPIGK